MSKEKLEECFKGYLEQANNLGERGFCQDTDDYQEFLKDAIDELFGYMYECGFSANKKQADRYKHALEEIEEKIKEINGSKILTFPDLSLQENAKAIMGQCNEGYRKILDIISKAREG